MSWTYQSWMDTLRDVQKKASSDADFRSRAIGDAAGAIREISGREVPAGFRIRFADPGSEMVIPLAPAHAGDELSASQLEAVAGGTGAMAPYSCSPNC